MEQNYKGWTIDYEERNERWHGRKDDEVDGEHPDLRAMQLAGLKEDIDAWEKKRHVKFKRLAILFDARPAHITSASQASAYYSGGKAAEVRITYKGDNDRDQRWTTERINDGERSGSRIAKDTPENRARYEAIAKLKAEVELLTYADLKKLMPPDEKEGKVP